jgi:hypothetical protein
VSAVVVAVSVVLASIGAAIVGWVLGARGERARTEAASRAAQAELARVDADSEAQLERDLAAIPRPVAPGEAVSDERRAALTARWGRR